uniref:Putative mitochondrial fatty acid anion carrier protein/uncoupling protein n=1 Tax=Ixodes ricinus TaxID=34613 RepID=A0A0K8RII4_IXORI
MSIDGGRQALPEFHQPFFFHYARRGLEEPSTIDRMALGCHLSLDLESCLDNVEGIRHCFCDGRGGHGKRVLVEKGVDVAGFRRDSCDRRSHLGGGPSESPWCSRCSVLQSNSGRDIRGGFGQMSSRSCSASRRLTFRPVS